VAALTVTPAEAFNSSVTFRGKTTCVGVLVQTVAFGALGAYVSHKRSGEKANTSEGAES
jgi:hypothetical protein